MDARVVGLKLLNRCSKAPSLIVAWIIRASALKPVTKFMAGSTSFMICCTASCHSAATELVGLRSALDRLSDSADPNICESASRYCDWL